MRIAQPDPAHIIRGHKAAVANPNVSDEAKEVCRIFNRTANVRTSSF